jgi:predicted DNA-binding transcriptional regulator YafY
MTEVEILDEKRRDFSEVSEYRNSFNIADYTRNLHGMMTGKIESVEIRFRKELTTAVIDKFGVDLTIKDVKEDTFVARVKAEISDAFISWLFTFGRKAEALTPDLRELMAQKASELNDLYNLP